MLKTTDSYYYECDSCGEESKVFLSEDRLLLECEWLRWLIEDNKQLCSKCADEVEDK